MVDHPAVEFLRQAHARAEELALAATPGPWRVDDLAHPEAIYGAHGREPEDALHIAMHDPVAVLRRVAAERELLAEHKSARVVGYDGFGVAMIDTCVLCGSQYAPYPCRTVLLLAQAWGWAEEAP